MAFPIQIMLSTGNKVSLNYQSQEVGVSLTYQLEREDTDVLAVVREKTTELVAAHALAWARMRGEEAAEETTSSAISQASAPDTHDWTAAPDEPVASAPTANTGFLSGAQLGAIEALFVQGGWSQSRVEEHLLNEFGKSEITELSPSEAGQLLLELQRQARTRAQEARQARFPTTNPNGRY